MDVKVLANIVKEFEKIKDLDYKVDIKKLFNIGLSCFIVCDVMFDEEIVEMWDSLGFDFYYMEYKVENIFDWLILVVNFCFIECVVEGFKFDFEMVYIVYSYDDNFVE